MEIMADILGNILKCILMNKCNNTPQFINKPANGLVKLMLPDSIMQILMAYCKYQVSTECK